MHPSFLAALITAPFLRVEHKEQDIESFSLLSFYLKIYNVHTVLRAIIFIFVLFLCIIPIGFSDIISLIGFADAIWNLRRFCRRVY